MFKPGDKVIRINKDWGIVKVGKQYTVYDVTISNIWDCREQNLHLVGFRNYYNPINFILAPITIKRNLVMKGLP